MRIAKIVLTGFCLLALSALPARAQQDVSKDELLGMFAGDRPERRLTMADPHRSLREMGVWASNQAAEALQIEPGQAQKTLARNRAVFTPAGFGAYMKFLQSLPFAAALQQDKLEMTSVVDAQPLLVGQASTNGRYVWVYELPVLVTAVDHSRPGSAPRSKDITLRIQIGRSAAAKNDVGVLIENWGEFVEGKAVAAPTGTGAPRPAK